MDLSRHEKILRAIIDGTEYTDPPQSRIEALLIELLDQGGGGGSDAYDITFSPGDDGYTADKTFAEAMQAFLGGKVLRAFRLLEIDGTPAKIFFGTLAYAEESIVFAAPFGYADEGTSYINIIQLVLNPDETVSEETYSYGYQT